MRQIPIFAAVRRFSQMADEKLKLLRDLLNENKLDAYIIRNTDPHQRIKFISNFSGSNATALITKTEALCWTDGRYYTQAANQLGSEWKMMKMAEPGAITPDEWLAQNLVNGVLGFDASLQTADDVKVYEKALGVKNIVAVEPNLVDSVWKKIGGRPEPAIKPVTVLKNEEHGQPTPEKIKNLRATMATKKVDALLVTDLDDIMWTLNIRGNDILYNPLAYSLLFIENDKVTVFIDSKKLTDEAKAHFENDSVNYTEYSAAVPFLKEWTANHSAVTVFLPSTANYLLMRLFKEAKIKVVSDTSPVAIAKAVKNPVELAGMRKSHIRDSVVLVQYFHWLQKELEAGHSLTEAQVADKIDKWRLSLPECMDLSFDTIAAIGENAALPHYSLNTEKKVATTGTTCVLVDSGAQDGTTDVTRTIWVKDVPADFRTAFTLVLQGHIDTAQTLFPQGILGSRLDTLSRFPLWQHGLDYGHGTGHGVGHFLNVHEGPCKTCNFFSILGGISYRTSNKDGGIKPGHILTIEPGYYLPGKYGIRIENCYEVIASETYKNFLTFESLTLVPIARNLIDVSLLEPKQIDWLNRYHDRVLKVIGEELVKKNLTDVHAWLKEQCAPISK